MIIGDIEDIIPRQRSRLSFISGIRSNNQTLPDVPAVVRSDEIHSLVIEENVLIYIRTWGCSHNTSDSEMMVGLLDEAGFRITYSDAENANVWLLNSCTAKTPSEDQLKAAINKGLEKDKVVIIAGCVPQADASSALNDRVSVVGVEYIDKVVDVVRLALSGHQVRTSDEFPKTGPTNLVRLPKVRKNPLIEILPVSSGCLNNCTYCKTKLARGNLKSFAKYDLIDRCKDAFAQGVKEIWLTSEDLGAYGRDIGTDIVDLVECIVRVTPSDCMLRLGMTNPPYIFNLLDGVIELLKHPNVYSFMHIPVQSGSDEVLQDMKREYNIRQFDLIVECLRNHIPEIYIATDIICGYPTETDEDFRATLDLIYYHRFPSLFINQYFQRSGTVAASLPQLSTKVKKQRTKAASEAFRSYEYYRGRESKIYKILLTEENDENLVGHNKFYEQIIVKKDPKIKLGTWITVEIIETKRFAMVGKPIEEQTAIAGHSGAFRKYALLTACTLGLAIGTGMIILHFNKINRR